MALLLFFIAPVFARPTTIPPKNYAVQVSAQAQENPSLLRLSWPADPQATQYKVSKRTRSSDWSQVAMLGGNATSIDDSNVQPGTVYEYQIIKTSSAGAGITGYGYIAAAIKAPLQDLRGKMILLVESSVAGPLTNELKQLQSDLVGDGWAVILQTVSRNDSPQSVKNVIKGIYEQDKANTKALLLFGNIPVPYSGNIAPDGHENHRGAWPADVYYGEMDGPWTDSVVNVTTSERQANWNVPGDGKFDQDQPPSSVELQVGRVDLANMTNFSNKNPARHEVDLLRQYLNKLHRWRMGEIQVERRGLICDNFSDKGDDPISGSAWRNMPAFFGAENITEVAWDQYIPTARAHSYLWSYGSGGGSYYYSTGVASSDDFALYDIKVVFTMWMGSYFGDWNNESNFLRSPLGSSSYTLTSTYSGFPHTLYFPMALGETIGYTIQLTQHNGTNGSRLYPPFNQGNREVHIALMGDPTLRMHPVKPASSVSASATPGAANISWTASSDTNIVGYHVYRATEAQGPFTRVTSSPVTGTSYSDTPASGSYFYMVRAIKLEQSGSGTYFNPSQGIVSQSVQVTGSVATAPTAPENVRATVISSSRIDLTWNDLQNETGYKVERKTGASGSWQQIATPGSNTAAYADTGLQAATEYFYRVRAFNNIGDSGYSSEARATTSSSAPTAPSVPQNLQASAVSSSRIDLSWNDLPNESGYKLERKTGATGSWQQINSPSANTVSYADNGLQGSTEYFYRLRAFNSVGDSGYSSEARATTPAQPQPIASATFLKTDTTTKGNWTLAYGVDGYDIAWGEMVIPSYAQISLSGKNDYLWEPSTSDSRALRKSFTNPDRVAAAWYGEAVRINLNVTSEIPKQFAIYMLDWDRQGRVTRVEVADAATGAILDSREVSNFGEGTYLVWNIKGSVQIRLNKVAGPNSLLMGLFFGADKPSPINNEPLLLSLLKKNAGTLTFTIKGKAGQNFILQSSDDFRNWVDVRSSSMTGTSMQLDEPVNGARRFYRTINTQ